MGQNIANDNRLVTYWKPKMTAKSFDPKMDKLDTWRSLYLLGLCNNPENPDNRFS